MTTETTTHEVQIRRMDPGFLTTWIVACITHRSGCDVELAPGDFYTAAEAIVHVIEDAQPGVASVSSKEWAAAQIAHGRKRVQIGPLVVHAIRRDGTITLVLDDGDLPP